MNDGFWNNVNIQSRERDREIDFSFGLTNIEAGQLLSTGRSEIVRIHAPTTVLTIDRNAFQGFTSIETFSIPHLVTVISYRCFYGCSSLKMMIFPINIEVINDLAFGNCNSLQKIVIENGNDIRITPLAFFLCQNLTTVVVYVENLNENRERQDALLKEFKEGDIDHSESGIFVPCFKESGIFPYASIIFIDPNGFENCLHYTCILLEATSNVANDAYIEELSNIESILDYLL